LYLKKDVKLIAQLFDM